MKKSQNYKLLMQKPNRKLLKINGKIQTGKPKRKKCRPVGHPCLIFEFWISFEFMGFEF